MIERTSQQLPTDEKSEQRVSRVGVSTGNLTRDPEIRYTANTGTAIARLNRAVNRPRTRTIRRLHINIAGCRHANVPRKGIPDRDGRSGYTPKGGVRNYTTNIVINETQFLDRGDEADDEVIDGDSAPKSAGDLLLANRLASIGTFEKCCAHY